MNEGGVDCILAVSLNAYVDQFDTDWIKSELDKLSGSGPELDNNCVQKQNCLTEWISCLGTSRKRGKLQGLQTDDLSINPCLQQEKPIGKSVST